MSYITENKENLFKLFDYSQINYEEFRYYQCTKTSFQDYLCKRKYYLDDLHKSDKNTKLISISSKIPESMDKSIINYKLMPNVNIEN
jgi:aspartyl/asparaginyl beta-hydroxylase (cupin superfamily)